MDRLDLRRADLDRAVRVGLRTTAAALALAFAYPFLPGHAPIDLGPYLAVLAAAGVIAGAAGATRRRLFEGAFGRTFIYLWMLADLAFVGAGVALSGGATSPLFLCFALVALFVTGFYPLRAQLVVLVLAVGSYLAALAASGGLEVADPFVRSAVIVLVMVLGAAIAWEKDKNAAEADRRAALLATVAKTAREISAGERAEIPEAVLEATGELGFEYAHLSVLEEESGQVRVLRARGLPLGLMERLVTAEHGLFRLVHGAAGTVWLEEYATHELAIPQFVAIGVTAVVGSPILVDGMVVGVLAAGSARRRPISPEDREAFELLAGIASRAFEGARRFEELAEREAQMRHMALHDELTGLANRGLLARRIDDALDRTGQRLTVMVLDLDDFKRVNDTLGHPTGDELLVRVAGRLAGFLPEGAVLARLSGDEFGILCRDLDGPAAADLARRLLGLVAEPITAGAHQVTVHASVGVTSTTVARTGPGERSATVDRLLQEADVAMYEAKRSGKACHVVFDAGMGDRLVARLAVESELHRAVDAGEMTVVYQPIFDLATGTVTGFEALLRWESPRLGTISPSEFIPVAEESGAIVPLGRWVLRQACEALQVLRRTNASWSDLSMSVNLSTRQLRDPDLVEDVLVTLAETWIPSWCLTLEITESTLMADEAQSEERLATLAALGISVALDDFGTGYSSLAYLQQLKVHALKVDRSFVDRLGSGKTAVALVRSIVHLAGALGLSTVAEGVETSFQLETLRSLGCSRGQGFLLARPLPAGDLAGFMASRGAFGGHASPLEPARPPGEAIPGGTPPGGP